MNIHLSPFAWFLWNEAEEIVDCMADEKRERWLEDYAALLALGDD